MKLFITIITALSIVLSANAQSFLAGWDFDGVSSTATSHTANWGSLFGSATLSYDHAGVNIPIKFTADYQISGSYDSAVVGIDFLSVGDFNGTDPSTGYTSFAGNDIPANAQQGINFVGPGTVTIDWGFALADTGTVSYSSLESGSWTTETVSVTSGETSYAFSANGFGIDNIQVIGTVIPEPSTYALILGFAAFLLGAVRKRQ
jgi:hypothetical protein